MHQLCLALRQPEVDSTRPQRQPPQPCADRASTLASRIDEVRQLRIWARRQRAALGLAGAYERLAEALRTPPSAAQ